MSALTIVADSPPLGLDDLLEMRADLADIKERMGKKWSKVAHNKLVENHNKVCHHSCGVAAKLEEDTSDLRAEIGELKTEMAKIVDRLDDISSLLNDHEFQITRLEKFIRKTMPAFSHYRL